MNDAFDILNCRSKSPYNRALSLDTYDMYSIFINKFDLWIKTC